MTDPKPLTHKQRELLEFIQNHIALASYAPTYEEIRTVLGITSKSVVAHRLGKLKDAGYITWTPNRARTIRVVEGSPHPERSGAERSGAQSKDPERSGAQSKDAETTAVVDE
jgi:repressor LexA